MRDASRPLAAFHVVTILYLLRKSRAHVAYLIHTLHHLGRSILSQPHPIAWPRFIHGTSPHVHRDKHYPLAKDSTTYTSTHRGNNIQPNKTPNVPKRHNLTRSQPLKVVERPFMSFLLPSAKPKPKCPKPTNEKQNTPYPEFPQSQSCTLDRGSPDHITHFIGSSMQINGLTHSLLVDPTNTLSNATQKQIGTVSTSLSGRPITVLEYSPDFQSLTRSCSISESGGSIMGDLRRLDAWWFWAICHVLCRPTEILCRIG